MNLSGGEGDMGGVAWRKMKGKCNNLFIVLSVNIHLLYKAETPIQDVPINFKTILNYEIEIITHKFQNTDPSSLLYHEL